MTAIVNYNEAADTYELGGYIEGVFFPFLSTPGPQVRSHVATQEHAAAVAAAAEAGTAAPAAGPLIAPVGAAPDAVGAPDGPRPGSPPIETPDADADAETATPATA